jgi:hypothetical protein
MSVANTREGSDCPFANKTLVASIVQAVVLLFSDMTNRRRRVVGA